jgi:hypothetical protein
VRKASESRTSQRASSMRTSPLAAGRPRATNSTT